MDQKFSVDDILAELGQKKKAPEPPASSGHDEWKELLGKVEQATAPKQRPAARSAQPMKQPPKEKEQPVVSRQPVQARPEKAQPAQTPEERYARILEQRRQAEELSKTQSQPQQSVKMEEPQGQKTAKKINFKVSIPDENPVEEPQAQYRTRLDLPIIHDEPEQGDAKDRTQVIDLSQGDQISENRMQKAKNFVLHADLEEPAEEKEPDLSKQEIDDYEDPSDTKSILREINSIRLSLTIRLLLTLISAVGLVYLAFSLQYPLPLPSILFPETDMRMFLGANLAVMIFAILVCNTTVGGGLISLFTLKADNDSPVALACLSTLIAGAGFIIFPDTVSSNGAIHLYFAIAVLGLLFNTIGKLMMIGRVKRNFRFVSSKEEKYALLKLMPGEFSRVATKNMDLGEAQIAYPAKSGFLTGFLEQSYVDDYTENISHILTPVYLLVSIAAAGLCYFMTKDILVALTALSALLCICAPFTTTIAANLPLLRASKKLQKEGGMVVGFPALEQYHDINCVMVKASDLFPAGSITLHGIKVFRQELIDQAIVDAASVMCSCSGTLSDMFFQLIGGNDKLLKRVDSVVYEDGMGMSSWVDGKRVLIGNRDLMKHHGVEIPSRDYEAKYTQGGRQILYLANSGELTAMYVLSYGGDEQIVDQLDQLARRGIALLVHTTDPNITPQRIGEALGFPEELVSVIPAKLHAEYDALTAVRDKAPATIACMGTLPSMLRTLNAASNLKKSVSVASFLQLAGVVLGYALMVFMIFTGGMATMGFEKILIYQAFWLLAILIAPNLRRI